MQKKKYSLTMYLHYLYKNEIVEIETSPINTLTFAANGTELLIARDSTYYTSVVPYQKFENTLPTGYYLYSFSLEPQSDQPSGHLNFSTFDSVVFNITSNSQVLNQPYYMTTVVKEYNILRVISGMSSLAWN